MVAFGGPSPQRTTADECTREWTALGAETQTSGDGAGGCWTDSQSEGAPTDGRTHQWIAFSGKTKTIGDVQPGRDRSDPAAEVKADVASKGRRQYYE